ncbi:MAG: efflux RND transporter periplasmic adaptor subunit [Bacteroidetes bacterium]|nr:efflux RND transporter periplasmic adaptor subunit [Bacteroidota bacterium]
MKRKIFITLSIVILVALIAFRLAANKHKIEESNQVVDRSEIPIPVTTVKTGMQAPESVISLPAETEAFEEVKLTVNTSGRLATINFDRGSRVVKGQRLGGIDVTQKQLSLEAAQLLVDKTERDYKNFKSLFESKAASENDYKNAQYNYENAKSQAAQIRQQIADGSIVSPISGEVVDKRVQQGEFVNIGTTLGTVVDVSRLKATVMVSESVVYRLKEGMTVSVTSDVYAGQKFQGKVRFISPKGDQNHNYPVEITIDNNKKNSLKAGTFVRVTFDIKSNDKILMIPKSALAEGLANPYVYVVENGHAKVRKIVVGRESGESIEAISGLNAGEEIILSGLINLRDGSVVEVISK